MQKILFGLLAILSPTGCELFVPTRTAEEIAKEKFKDLDLSSVDVYPTFGECEQVTVDREEEWKCFKNKLSQHLQSSLDEHPWTTRQTLVDTLYLTLLIDNQGTPSIEQLETTEQVTTYLPELEAVLKRNIAQLPKIYAARKTIQYSGSSEEILVSVVMTLPLVIKTI